MLCLYKPINFYIKYKWVPHHCESGIVVDLWWAKAILARQANLTTFPATQNPSLKVTVAQITRLERPS